MVSGHGDFPYESDGAIGEPVGGGAQNGARSGATTGLALSIFAGRASLREELREDAIAAGFSIRVCESPRALIGDGPESLGQESLGEVVLIDCPVVTEAGLEALAQLDARVARTGANLIVSTSLEALDGVFLACERSDAEILVNPTRAERVVALGRVLAHAAKASVRELSEADRLMLLRLTEQVGQIAERLEGIGGVPTALAAGAPPEPEAAEGDRAGRATRPPLPDPRLVRRIIATRQRRSRYFDGELFADPAWDMLLDLTAARAEHVRVSVTSLCIASGVPPTTALRWIGQMAKAGLVERIEDDADKRRAFIVLNDKTADALARYFAEIGNITN